MYVSLMLPRQCKSKGNIVDKVIAKVPTSNVPCGSRCGTYGGEVQATYKVTLM